MILRTIKSKPTLAKIDTVKITGQKVRFIHSIDFFVALRRVLSPPLDITEIDIS